MVSTVLNKPVVESGLAGPEGMACVATFLGANSTPRQGIVQMQGRALKVKANVLREEFKRGGRLQDLLLLRIQTLTIGFP